MLWSEPVRTAAPGEEVLNSLVTGLRHPNQKVRSLCEEASRLASRVWRYESFRFFQLQNRTTCHFLCVVFSPVLIWGFSASCASWWSWSCQGPHSEDRTGNSRCAAKHCKNMRNIAVCYYCYSNCFDTVHFDSCRGFSSGDFNTMFTDQAFGRCSPSRSEGGRAASLTRTWQIFTYLRCLSVGPATAQLFGVMYGMSMFEYIWLYSSILFRYLFFDMFSWVSFSWLSGQWLTNATPFVRWSTCSFSSLKKVMFAFDPPRWPSCGHVQALSNAWDLSEPLSQDFPEAFVLCRCAFTAHDL